MHYILRLTCHHRVDSILVSHNPHPLFDKQSQHQSNHRLHRITNKDTTAVLVFAVIVLRTTCHTLSYILHRCSFGDDECVFCSINVTRSMVVWNTCCHGIGHACIGLLLLHAVTAQDTCARNQIWCKKVWWAYDANGDRIDPAEAPIAFALTRKTHKCKCVNAADINDSGCCVAETVKGRCQKNEFWCKKVFTPSGRHNIPPTHQCDCPGNLDNSGCCVMCGWGQYREGIMEDTACEPCPATTLLTDYKSDKRVRTPCANCGVAFGWVELG